MPRAAQGDKITELPALPLTDAGKTGSVMADDAIVTLKSR